MKSKMKKFTDLPGDVQVEMKSRLKDGELDRMSFPYKGQLTDGVIFLKNEDGGREDGAEVLKKILCWWWGNT